jgi:hypothetical protein
MSRTLSFVIALASLALVVAAPAVGKPVPGPGAQLNSEDAIVPDAFERAVHARVSSADTRVGPMVVQSNGLHQYWNGFSQAARIGPMEARSNGLHEYWPTNSSQASIAPDAFERAVQAHVTSTPSGDGFLTGDDHVRLDPSQLPTVIVTPVSSGNAVEWPQIGIGFLVGILLMLGIALTVRYTRHPPLAH